MELEEYARATKESWPTGTPIEYGASAALLRGVWYAEMFLDDERKAIGWEQILEAEREFSPSEGEQLVVEIAFALWTGHGAWARPFRIFDTQNLEAFFRALEIKAGRRTVAHA